MRIARTLDWKGERLIQSRLYHDQSPGSIPMDGNATAEASITPQWLPDSPKTGAPCGNRRTSAGGHFLRNHSLFEFVNAERLSDLIVSLLPRVLRQCALASLGQRSRIESLNMSIRNGHVVFGAARVYTFTVPGPKWKSWLRSLPGSRCSTTPVRRSAWRSYHKGIVARIGVETEFALSQAVGSGNGFEHGPAEVGHRIQDYLAVFDLCDLPREAANYEPMADDGLGEKSLFGWTPMSVYY